MTPTSKPTIVGLVPARGGSKRVPGKNIRLLGGKPLIAWTIEAALESGIFSRVYVSSDDEETLRIAGNYDVVAMMRPAGYAADDSPDIQWVAHTLRQLDTKPDAFSILRPTSPFRSADTIQRAWRQFLRMDSALGSLRAVEAWDGPPPAKMWYAVNDDLMEPIDERWTKLAPRHSSPSQLLPRVYRQTAGLEMTWTDCVLVGQSLSGGHCLSPFVVSGDEALDINTEDDWGRALDIARGREEQRIAVSKFFA